MRSNDTTKALKAKKDFGQTWVFRIFVVISSCLAVAEPVIVSYQPTPVMFNLQIAVLAAASFTFFLDILLTSMYYENTEKLSFFEMVRDIVEGENMLDALSLLYGWCTIFTNPGLAALRCIRVFRLLWYFELFPEVKMRWNSGMFSLRKASRLCLLYMKGIGMEFFTEHSKGGVVVIAMYLYLSYLMAVVFWVELNDLISINEGVPECRDLNTCFITIIRLSFYDGNGFDFLQTLAMQGHGGYCTLLFVYMFMSAIVILNGLVGIFGNAFVSAVDDNDNSNETAEGQKPIDSNDAGAGGASAKEDALIEGVIASNKATPHDNRYKGIIPINSLLDEPSPSPHVSLQLDKKRSFLSGNKSKMKPINSTIGRMIEQEEMLSMMHTMHEEIMVLQQTIHLLHGKIDGLKNTSA